MMNDAFLRISLAGRNALITGAGAGIGKAIAKSFGQLGARVFVLEKDAVRCAELEASLASWEIDAVVQVCDVTKSDEVRRAMSNIEHQIDGLDILVNNVGDAIRQAKGPFEDSDPDEWADIYDVNLRQVFSVTQSAIPLLRRGHPGGSIINVSTIEAFRAVPHRAVYSAVKGALTSFTQSLALELGPDGIRVNAIAPETIETEYTQSLKDIPPEYYPHIPSWFPLGRWGQPEDAAGCAVFLATDLSAWVTGTTVHLDGGALAAAGWHRMPSGEWTHRPIISAHGYSPIAARTEPTGEAR